MDKPKKGNTITIKLNGEQQNFKEEPKKDLEANVIQAPKERMNHIDSDVFSETAAAQETVDESFDWIIPESSENEIEEYKIVSHKTTKKGSVKKLTTVPSKMKKNKRPLGSILISALFAILIGTTIGFFMLKLVITDQTGKSPAQPAVVEGNGSNKGADQATGETSSAVISPVTAYVVQGGYFTSKEGSQEISKQLDAKGVPSQTIEMDGKFYLLLGVTDSIETAKLLGNHYKENGVTDFFAKSLELGEKNIPDLNGKEKTFLEAVPVIYQALSAATSNAQLTSISQEASKTLAGIENQLNVNGIKNEKVKNLQTELMSANEKVKAFQKEKSQKNLTDAQQHLLNFLSLYNRL